MTPSSHGFRQIGGLIGVAIFGTLMSTHVRNNLAAELPAQVGAGAPAPLLERLEDPQVLLSPEALDRLRDAFAALGSEGPRLFEATIGSMRSVLADGLELVFVAGLAVTVVALVVSVFLKDIPLRGAPEAAMEGAGEIEGIAQPAPASQSGS